MENKEKVIEVKNLKMYFPVQKNILGKVNLYLRAVNGVSFYINKGETLGLVGESGCGKTTVGRCITRLYTPTSGEIIMNGKDIANLDNKEMQPFRKKMHMIFQDPFASLNPRMTVGEIILEPMHSHNIGDVKTRKDRVKDLLGMVGLNPDFASRFPHEFSGGQRQRIGIARSLSANPEFIVCDEPISALDVSIQAQVVNLLDDLQKEFGLAYLFIAHDLSMVKYISDRVGVMYLGKIVEMADSDELYANPLHPYTKALISAIPIPDPDLEMEKKRIILKGEIPSPIGVQKGCSFKTRCTLATEECRLKEPELVEIKSGHYAACHKLK